MKQNLKVLTLSSVGVLALSIAGFAMSASAADSEDRAEAVAFNAAPVSLRQAIAAAETETGAKAISAEFENEDGKWIYSVELITSSGDELEAEVDAQSAAILEVETGDEDDEDEDEAD